MLFTTTGLEAMKVAELREIIKTKEIQMPGAWKAKKEELIEAILSNQTENEITNATEAQIEAEDRAYQAEVWAEIENRTADKKIEEVQIETSKPEKTRKIRKNKKHIHVVQKDGAILDFDSNKKFADYFNSKYETKFRNDIAWYLIRDRNKKAKEVFQIETVVEV